MRLLVVAAVLAAPSLASSAPTIEDAFPPTIRVGTPSSYASRIDRVRFDRGEVAWLAIELSQPRSFERELVVPIDLPAGTRVLGVQLERDDKVVWGQPFVERAATARYQRAASAALVAWAGSTGGEDHVAITVRDVTSHNPVTVTLALLLPAIPNLRVEPSRVLVVDGQRATGPVSLAVAPPADATTDTAVDARTSLFADPEVDVVTVVVAMPSPDQWMTPSIDKFMIRRRMKTHVAQLRQCYMHVAQWHPEVEGKIELHFTIEDDGHVSDATADGELASDDVKACLARTAHDLEFPPAPGGGRVRVNYPIDFRLDR